MKSLTDDDPVSIGDRVIVTATDSNYGSQAGVIVSEDNVLSMYYQMRVVVVLLESGLRIQIATMSLVKSPYQNEPLEAVPSV